MYGETNHHASTIGVNVKFKARFVKFDSAEIVLFFAEGKSRNLFEVGCLANVSSPSSHLRCSKGFCLCRLLPNQSVKLAGIEYPKKVLLQLLQWQIVGASCSELPRLLYHIDGIPCPTSGIGSTKDGFRVYLCDPSLNHGFSLLVCHIA